MLQQAIERVTYEGSSRRVVVAFRDGTQSAYVLAEAIRTRRGRTEPIGRTPRISRLMALAIRIERLAREGPVDSYSKLAELGQISASRLSQIRRLSELAPSIQEELLFLPKIIAGRDPVHESAMRKIAGIVDWQEQVKAFRALMAVAQTA
jgi:hypothetical protein